MNDSDVTSNIYEQLGVSLQELLQKIPTLECQTIAPQIANCFTHLLIEWDELRLGISRAELKNRLRHGIPAIVTGRVDGTGDEGFLISVVNMHDDEIPIVARRTIQVLSRADS